MNEQEMIQRQKIEKREKTDIILAYILIVILLAGIGIVLYLKYGSSQDKNSYDMINAAHEFSKGASEK